MNKLEEILAQIPGSKPLATIALELADYTRKLEETLAKVDEWASDKQDEYRRNAGECDDVKSYGHASQWRECASDMESILDFTREGEE